MGVQQSADRLGKLVWFTPRAATVIISGLVACSSAPTPTAFEVTTWERELPPGWAPRKCISSEVFSAATDLDGALAAGQCTRLRDLVDFEVASKHANTTRELETALNRSSDLSLALDAWQLGGDLQAQGTMLIHGLGTRYIDIATRFLAEQVATGVKLDAATTREVAYLAARDLGLRRAFSRERHMKRPPTGGCSGGDTEAFDRAMDAAERAIEQPYEERWDILLGLDDEAQSEGWDAWPSVRTYIDQVVVAQGRGLALAVAIGATPAHVALDPITAAPIQYNRDLCAFTLTATYTQREAEVSVPCPQSGPEQ